jgi:hypothetical protein
METKHPPKHQQIHIGVHGIVHRHKNLKYHKIVHCKVNGMKTYLEEKFLFIYRSVRTYKYNLWVKNLSVMVSKYAVYKVTTVLQRLKYKNYGINAKLQ